MVIFLRAWIYLTLGGLLILGCVWYVNSLWEAFRSTTETKVILPFTLVNDKADEDEKSTKLGEVMAQMLSARLSQIQQELIDTANALDSTRQGNHSDQKLPQDLALLQPISLGYGGTPFKTIDLKMSVSGVDISGIFSWLQSFFSDRDGLQLYVNYNGDTCVIVGRLKEDNESMWLSAATKTEVIINTVAYNIAYRRFVKKVQEAEAITPDEFQKLMSALKEIRDLNHLILKGRQPEQEKFTSIINTLEDLARKTPRWRALIHIIAETAENAKNIIKAIEFYKLEYGIVQQDSIHTNKDSQLTQIQSKLNYLTKEINQNLSQAVAKTTADNNNNNAEPKVNPLLENIHKLIGYKTFSPNKEVRVAILGGIPTKDLLDNSQFEIINSQPKQWVEQDAYLTDYISSLTQSVLISAPKAHFIYLYSPTASTQVGESGLLHSIQTLASAKPDILIITFGPLEKLYETVFQRLADSGVLIVVAAGNDPKIQSSSIGKSVLDRIMVVSSVDEKGFPSSFTSRDTKNFWAPGEGIPVRQFNLKKDSSILDTRKGTSFAAAIAAGIAASALSIKALSPDKMVNLLRATSLPVNTQSNSPSILNQKNALEKIGLNTE